MRDRHQDDSGEEKRGDVPASPAPEERFDGDYARDEHRGGMGGDYARDGGWSGAGSAEEHVREREIGKASE